MKIRLEDLPDNVYIRLENNFKKLLFLKTKSKCNDQWVQLASTIGITYNSLLKLRRPTKLIRLSILKRLMEIDGLQPNEIKSYVRELRLNHGATIKVRLPITITPELAELFAHSLGDGHITPRFNFKYVNTETKMITCIKNIIFRLFDREDFYLTKSSYNIPVISYPRTIGFILHLFGAPTGNKTLSDFKLPDWLFRANQKVKRAFLRALFDDEGYVRYSKKKATRSVGIAFSKLAILEHSLRNLLNDLKRLLNEFGVKTSPVKTTRKYVDGRSREKIVLTIEIWGRENLIKFREEISFYHPKKLVSLNMVLNSYIFPRGVTKNKIIELLRKHPQTTKEITTKLGLSCNTIRSNLNRLRKSGIVRKIGLRNGKWCVKSEM